MHLQGQLQGGVQLLKDGRLAHGMDINGAAADPRLNALHDMCHQGQFPSLLLLIMLPRSYLSLYVMGGAIASSVL